jgi:alkanesulfonate monooxygenase SsuD/methylene tetrahydromethanopterin reductase-like flavin-dependent oxidoreductase (luciferase family)
VFGDRIRFGVYSGPQHATFEDCLELWRRCEELGYDWLSVFDHFMPIVGDPNGPCFEGPTMMAAMAAHTTRVRVAILVTGVTYRHPAVAANIAATIDHVSGGRADEGSSFGRSVPDRSSGYVRVASWRARAAAPR